MSDRLDAEYCSFCGDEYCIGECIHPPFPLDMNWPGYPTPPEPEDCREVVNGQDES